MKKLRRETLGTLFLFFLIFLFFLLFFFRVHPIVIFDTDDWGVSHMQRSALPQLHAWNPGKILPEILMPLVTLAGASIFGPLTQDHFLAVSLGYAVTVSLCVTVLAWLLYRMLDKGGTRLALLSFFLLCHFWIYRKVRSGNLHMLYAANATCYFNYVIPNLLNCALVLWLMHLQRTGKSIQEGFVRLTRPLKALFIMAAYFSIFSNLFSSIITAAYVGTAVLFDLVRTVREKRFSLSRFFKSHLAEAAILLMWACLHLFELSGGRAADFRGEPFGQNLLRVIASLWTILYSLNLRFFLTALALLVLGGLVILRSRDGRSAYQLAVLFTVFLVTGLYLILCCAKVSGSYLARPDVQYGCFFYGMLILLVCAGAILRKIPRLKPMLPLLLVVILCNCNTPSRTFADPTMGGYSSQACLRFCRDVVQQFTEAEAAGQTQLTLIVPSFPASEDNFPLALYGGPVISEYLYKMGLTERLLEVSEMEVSPDKNIELGLY